MNEHLRTSSRRRITRLTSARVSARTQAAATRSWPSRVPAMTTQLTEASTGTWYAATYAAVSASPGSLADTSTRSATAGVPLAHAIRAACVAGARSSGWSMARSQSRSPSGVVRISR